MEIILVDLFFKKFLFTFPNRIACIHSLFWAGSSTIKNFLSGFILRLFQVGKHKERIIRGFDVFGLVVGCVWVICSLVLFLSLDLCGHKECKSLWA